MNQLGWKLKVGISKKSVYKLFITDLNDIFLAYNVKREITIFDSWGD